MSEIRSQATPARDELAEAMVDDLFEAENCGELMTWDDNGTPWVNREAIAETLVPKGWSKPRTVHSATELDALPVNSVVVDASDTPRTKRYGDSHMGAGWTNAGRSPLSSRELADGRPMRVLFTPGDAG
ncbi:hypothetical protein ACU5JM_09510 [Rhodococcus erythropolis]|uniref:hypothetical protein n=1 Tax=Rhodococcus erythropolis TaxID=1833 RepID=UPI00406BAF80